MFLFPLLYRGIIFIALVIFIRVLFCCKEKHRHYDDVLLLSTLFQVTYVVTRNVNPIM